MTLLIGVTDIRMIPPVMSRYPRPAMVIVLTVMIGLISQPSVSRSAVQAQQVMKRGTLEVGLQTGYWKAFTGVGPATSSNREAVFVLPQIGYVFTDPMGSGYARGVFEVLVEPAAAHFFEPFSASLFGGSLVARYNFLSFGKFMPYWDIGAGMSWTDLAPRIPEQSTQFEFLLETGPGLKYFWYEGEDMVSSFSLGARWHHISNANTGSRNVGLNAVLGLVGISFFFP